MTPDTHSETRGRLRIFLGYAAGVGKTFQMLSEGQDLRREGADVVIGYFESHGRKDTIAKTEGLETVPRRTVEYRGANFAEMDTEAILRRAPRICLVDELAHTNVPGSAREKRWEDVLVLLESGMDVFTTVNVQHLESLNDQVFQITGIRVRETFPDWVLGEADEVVMVDLTPRALLNRLVRGVVYAPDKAERALEGFFKESTLVALRELALREAAHHVDVRVVDMELRLPPQAPQSPAAGIQRKERILVNVPDDPIAAVLIRRARRVADYLDAECFAVHVQKSAAPAENIQRMLNFARNLHIEAHLLEGKDAASTLAQFARAHGVTQIFVGRPRYSGLRWLVGRHDIHRIVRLARDMEVTIVGGSHRGPSPERS